MAFTLCADVGRVRYQGTVGKQQVWSAALLRRFGFSRRYRFNRDGDPIE